MKLRFTKNDKTSFLTELNKKKTFFNVTVDDWSYEVKGKSVNEWDAIDNHDGSWSLCYYSEDYCIEFILKMDGDCKGLTPMTYTLYQGDSIIDWGEFNVE